MPISTQHTCSNFFFFFFNVVFDTVILLIDCLVATHLRQNPPRSLSLPFLNQPAGAFREKQETKELYNCWYSWQPQHVPGNKEINKFLVFAYKSVLWEDTLTATRAVIYKPNLIPLHSLLTEINQARTLLWKYYRKKTFAFYSSIPQDVLDILLSLTQQLLAQRTLTQTQWTLWNVSVVWKLISLLWRYKKRINRKRKQRCTEQMGTVDDNNKAEILLRHNKKDRPKAANHNCLIWSASTDTRGQGISLLCKEMVVSDCRQKRWKKFI